MFADATIVFDPDGTLVDTAPDLTNALNDVLPAAVLSRLRSRPSAAP